MKKNVIIAFWGHGSQGKTSTIKELTKLILQNNPNTITVPAQINFKYDIRATIIIGKIKIGIESKGDNLKEIEKSLQDFVNDKCNIIICATRTSGATVDYVSDLTTRNNYDGIWTTNYRSNDKPHFDLNKISAQHHFELLKDIISGVI